MVGNPEVMPNGVVGDYSREVLVLYRERSGEESSGNAALLSAGAFSIQRLEGSRYGTVQLWILDGDAGGEGWGRIESIFRARPDRFWWEDYLLPWSRKAGDAGTRGALVFGSALKSK